MAGYAHKLRRVLYQGDPREEDYIAMRDEVEAIRVDLVRIRGRLEAVGRSESRFWFDSIAHRAAAALGLAARSLFDLIDGGDSDLRHRAERARELWADAEARPDAYVIEPGTDEGPRHSRRFLRAEEEPVDVLIGTLRSMRKDLTDPDTGEALPGTLGARTRVDMQLERLEAGRA